MTITERPETVTYSTTEVAELVGITYRMCDYWCRIGLVTPSIEATGSGSRRRWTEEDLAQLRRVKLASELSSGSLMEALDRLDELFAELGVPA